jgi:hypothetical protein
MEIPGQISAEIKTSRFDASTWLPIAGAWALRISRGRDLGTGSGPNIPLTSTW